MSWLVCLLCLASFHIPSRIAAQEPKTPQELKEAIEKILQETNTPGIGYAIVSADEILLNEGIGLANRDPQTQVTTETMFRAGSISKSFTALAILKLVEAGKLDLQAKLSDLVPEVKFTNPWEASHPVRLVHLLEHTTGFNEITLREFVESNPDAKLKQSIEFDPSRRISRWPPGKFFSYSNANYAVAGYILEKASGESYEAYLDDNLLRPLEMGESSFLLTEPVKRRLAIGYNIAGGEPRSYEHILGRSSGALNCSTGELAHLVQMFLKDGMFHGQRIISQESIVRMETPTASVTAEHGLQDGYGLANYSISHKGFRLRGHSGAMDGYLAAYRYSRERGVGTVVMMNSSNGAAFRRSEDTLLDYICREWPAPLLPESTMAAEDQLAPLAGYYEPFALRFEESRFLDRLTGIRQVSAKQGKLHVEGSFGPFDVYIATNEVDQFRDNQSAKPSLLIHQADGKTYLVNALHQETHVRIPAWQFWMQHLAVLYCILISLSAVLFAFIWIPRKLFGRMRDVTHLSVRAIPLSATLCAVGPLVILTLAMADPVVMLGKPTLWSVSLCVLTCLLPLMSLLGMAQVVRAYRWPISRWVWRHSLLVSIANIVIASYFAYWGLVGLRTWA